MSNPTLEIVKRRMHGTGKNKINKVEHIAKGSKILKKKTVI